MDQGNDSQSLFTQWVSEVCLPENLTMDRLIKKKSVSISGFSG
jgi:hypothetical protein